MPGTADGPIELVAGGARVVVDPARGGRLVRLTVDGLDLVLADGPDPFGSGAFVMAPWAGRVRDGVAVARGRHLAFPTGPDGHALHGLVHDRAWRRTGPASCAIDLDDGWFGPIRVEQRVALDPHGLTVALTLAARSDPVPATLGWHPWFPRTLTRDGTPVGGTLRLELAVGSLLVRGPRGLPDGTRRPVDGPIGAGPWDDAFLAPRWPARLVWPGALALRIGSDAPVAIVYTEEPHAWCVEPQTGPPDEVNMHPRTVRPGAPLGLTVALRWGPDA